MYLITAMGECIIIKYKLRAHVLYFYNFNNIFINYTGLGR